MTLLTGGLTLWPNPVSPAIAEGGDPTATPLPLGLVSDLSTATSSTYREADGSMSFTAYAEPVNYQDSAGAWQPIDNSLVEAPGAAYDVQNAANAFTAKIPEDPSVTPIKFVKDGAWVTMRMHGVDDQPAAVAGSEASFDNVAKTDGVTYQAYATGLKESIKLDAPPVAALSYAYTIDASAGLTPEVESDGSVQFLDSDEAMVFTIPAGVMTDSSEIPTESQDVSYDLAVSGGAWTLTVTPGMDWLTDSARVYPVTIDPSLTYKPTPDCWLGSGAPDDVHCGGSSLYIKTGRTDSTHKYRGLLYFDTSAIPKAANVSAAALHVFLDHTQTFDNTKSADWALYTAGKGFNSSATWNTSGANGSWTGGDPGSTAYGTQTLTGSSDGDKTFTGLVSLVQGWVDGTITRRGVVMKQVGEATNNQIAFWSASGTNASGVRPYLSVTYNTAPNKPVAPTVAPGNSGYAASTTPTLTASVTDPDGTTVRGDFQVLQGSTVVWSGNSSMVASGGTATVTVPSGTLSNGTTYTVKVKADDGTTTSSYSTATPMTVDTTAPTVTVTSSGFTNGQWTATPPASNTFTLTGTTDTNSFSYSEDGGQSEVIRLGALKTGALTADTSNTDGTNPSHLGRATVSWNPSQGAHVLSVTPIDKAGNLGSPVSFTFGVGSAGFSVPNAQELSTAVFPIQAMGAAGATGATLTWRYANTSTWNTISGVKTVSGSSYAGSVSTLADGSASTTGPLTWDATAQTDPASQTGAKLASPALVELRACFTYASGPDSCSSPRQVQLVGSGFAGNGAVTQVGPAQVALSTGEATVADTDAVDVSAGLGRIFSSFDASTVTDGAFGPGWSAASLAATSDASGKAVSDNRSKDGTLVLTSVGGGSQTFAPQSGSTSVYQPAGVDDGSRLTVDASASPNTLTLTGVNVGTTVWQLTSAGWTLFSATAPGSSPEQVAVANSSGKPTWVSQVPAGSSATCTATAQDPGCRGLKITYNGAGHVTQVDQVAYNPNPGSDGLPGTGAGFDTVTVAQYTYDGNGRLSTICDPRISQTGGYCTNYTYTTVGGRTLLATITPVGQVAWRFGYDTAGRLTTVKRALDPDTNTGSGDSTWTLVYDITPTTSGLPDLSANTAANWGQTTLPITATALFPPSHVPSATPTSSDWPYGRIWYATADGSNTNTAEYGAGQWLVDGTWYDSYGNVVRVLNAAGRAAVMAAATADRPKLAFEQSQLTVYSTDGSRVEDEYGISRTATLKDGTIGRYRIHTAYVYDDEDSTLAVGRPTPPNGQTAFDLPVEIDTSTTNPDLTGAYDPVVTRDEYTPNVSTDGSGWTFGQPTRQKTQLADGSWVTRVRRFDAVGRTIETRQPGGGAASDGSGNDAHSSSTIYYTADSSAADSQCRNQPNWAGLVCRTGPAAQPAGTTIPVTYTLGYDRYLRATRIEDRSGSTTRTTVSTYDGAGRLIGQSKTVTGGNGADPTQPALTIGYALNGQPSTWTAASKSITQTYDTWSRNRAFTDASGLVSQSTYTLDSQIATFNDGLGTYSYTYNSSTDHRAFPTTVDTGLPAGAGVFSLNYNTGGDLAVATYPNGLVSTRRYDEAGGLTGLDYTSGSTDVLNFSATLDVFGRVVGNDSASAHRTYTLDNMGRLRTTQDTGNAGCVTRAYDFSSSSDRTSLATYASASDGSCQVATATATWTGAYDAANRLINAGYTYDALGRTRSIPAADTATGAQSAFTANYFPDDMSASTSQSLTTATGTTVVASNVNTLDPIERTDSAIVSENSVEVQRLRYRYSDAGDSPTSIGSSVDGGATYTYSRYLNIPGLGLSASVLGGVATEQLSNLHGDIVATQDSTSGPGAVSTYSEVDEYGVGATNSSRYGYLGAAQRSTDHVGGVIAMGRRMYNPATGGFATMDPVLGGGATAYGYPYDPVNSTDLTGQYWWGGYHNYHGRFGFGYVRIWLNKRMMYAIAAGFSGAGSVAEAVGLIYGAIAVATYGSTAASAASWGLAALLANYAGSTLRYLADHGVCVGYRLFYGPILPVIGGYAYLSTYACTVGG